MVGFEKEILWLPHPTEFVFIRLAHLKDSAEIFEELMEWMNQPAPGGTNGSYVYKGSGNLALYWTSTGGNIETNTAKLHLSENFKQVRKMVKEYRKSNVSYCRRHNIPIIDTKSWSNAIALEDRARRRYAVYSVSLPNIILYDFVNEDTSSDIIKLNDLTVCHGS